MDQPNQSNRLLAMLNSATSPPPPTSLSSIPTANPIASLHHPSTSTASPHEPTPLLPPPSLQTVSLQDLFRNLTPAPAPPAPAQGSGTAQSPPQQEQQAKLLGMLKTLGGSEGPSGTGTPLLASSQADKQKDLLGMFKASGPNGNSLPAEPVITHPQPAVSRAVPSSVFPSTSAQSAASPASAPPAAAATPPAPTATDSDAPQVGPPPPKKSMFDFVSPFDAFDTPPKSSKAETPPARKTGVPESSAEPRQRVLSGAKGAKDAKPATQASTTTSLLSGTSGGSSARPTTGSPARQAAAEDGRVKQEDTGQKGSRVAPLPPTGSGITPASRSELALPWQVGKVVGGAQGEGPASLADHTVIDISKPSLSALVTDKSAVQIVPVTIKKNEQTTFLPGRIVGMTNGWTAYSLGKGQCRIRLIDQACGAKVVLHIPRSSAQGPIVDMAVTDTRVAVIGADHSITLFSVPSAWEKDDPPVEVLFQAVALTSADDGLGVPQQVEWVKKDGVDHLGIGGSGGVVLVKVDSARGTVSLTDLARDNRLLTADGSLVGFCVNQTHQAIGLLSATSFLSLYNVSTLNRVWHRQLPSSAPALPPSSVQFCEASILVGRENNTLFDLVQITVDLAVLSTIKFVSPSPSPLELNFTHAVYDAARTVLWITAFSRGSLYGFQYALKGKPPVHSSQGEKAIAFSKVAEYPLDPVLSLVLGRDSAEAAEIFFATPNGFSQANVSVEAMADLAKLPDGPTATTLSGSAAGETLSTPAPSAMPVTNNKVNEASNPTKAAASDHFDQQEKAIEIKAESASEREEAVIVQSGDANVQKAVNGEKRDIAPAATSEDLGKLLKKTEDRLMNQMRHVIMNQSTTLSARIDALSGGNLAADIAAKVDKQVKANLTSAVQGEMKRSVLPALQASMQSELQAIAREQFPSSVSQAMKTVPLELEKALAPGIQRTVTSGIQAAVDRALQDGLQRTTVPTVTNAITQLGDRLTGEIRSELLQLRKDLAPAQQEPAPNHEPLLRDMAQSISNLQKQVAELSAQVVQASRPPPFAHPHPQQGFGMPPPMAVQANQQHPPFPTPQALPPPPPPAHLEDSFLAALGAGTTAATLQLVNEYWNMTDVCLPSNGSKSPLSQAVMLTLLHRLALAIHELQPSDPTFTRVSAWEKRVAALLDPRDPAIGSYLPRVIPVVQGLLGNVLQSLQTRWAGEQTAAGQAMGIRQVLEIIGAKAS